MKSTVNDLDNGGLKVNMRMKYRHEGRSNY